MNDAYGRTSKGLQERIIERINRLEARRAYTPDTPLPAPISQYSTSGGAAITAAATTWQSIPSMDQVSFGYLEHDLLVRADFGAQVSGATTATYGMIGVYMDSPLGVRLQPEFADAWQQGGGGNAYGFTPFSQSAASIHLHGVKDFIVPAGEPHQFRMVKRRNTVTSSPSVGYSMLQIMPIRWLK